MGAPTSIPFSANLLNLFTSLSLILINLASIALFMNSVHLSIVFVVTIEDSFDLHLSNLTPIVT